MDYAGHIHHTTLEEREFVVDSGASMHMVSRKDLHSAELETVRISKNPTTVLTEAKENVRELDLFVKVMLLEETPAVLSLGKLCEDRGSTGNLSQGPAETEKPNKNDDNEESQFTSCKMCQIGYRSSGMDW